MGKAQDDHTRLSALVEELGLEGDEGNDFISSAMQRLGHVAKTVWDDAPAANGGGGGGDFFSSRRQQQQQQGGGGNGNRETRRVSGGEGYRG